MNLSEVLIPRSHRLRDSVASPIRRSRNYSLWETTFAAKAADCCWAAMKHLFVGRAETPAPITMKYRVEVEWDWAQARRPGPLKLSSIYDNLLTPTLPQSILKLDEIQWAWIRSRVWNTKPSYSVSTGLNNLHKYLFTLKWWPLTHEEP